MIVATLTVSGLLLTGATTRLDNAIYDFALRFRERPAPPDIVIVAIDFPSMARNGRWPWSRDVQASMIRNIARDHPRAIACDILFQSPLPGDKAVHDAMSGARVFLPEVLGSPGNGHAGFLARPTPEIGSAATGFGRSNPTPDVDGIVRRMFLFVSYQGELLPELMMQVAGQAADRVKAFAASSRGAAIARALVRSDEVLIPYAGPPGHYRQVSAADVVDGALRPGFFKDKYVLVGATAPGLLDNYPTPVSGAEGMPNIEVEANILDAILHHQLIRQVPPLGSLALSVAMVWILFFALVRFSPRQMVVQGPIGSTLLLLASAAGLVFIGLWFPPMPALITRTLVQIIWSSRRLQAASDYFARELADLQSRPGLALIPKESRRLLSIGDSVSRQMILLDDTKRRIRELRRFVVDVLANFPDPVLVLDAQGRIITVNPAAVRLGHRLGLSTDEGAQIQPILEDLEAAAGGGDKLWPPVATAGGTGARGVGPGGRILEARYTPTAQESDAARGWTLHLVDVTALVSAMRQREHALQLFTHDMRSPQSAILAALEHKEFQSVPLVLREGIERNAQRTITLADSFVRLAQAEAVDYAIEPIDLFHLLGDAADALWPTAQAASVEIVVEDPGREYVVEADRSLLARALINLLDNAIKFSPPEKSVVCALRDDVLHGRAAVTCMITDQATGMSQEQQASLFKRFARSSLTGDDVESRPVRSSGIGLGLAVVHTVVTRHDGIIECHSELGGGTVFSITLPLYAGENDEESPPPNS